MGANNTVSVSNGGTLGLFRSSITPPQNSGILRADGGSLLIQGDGFGPLTKFTNGGGTIEAVNSGIVHLNGVFIDGGLIQGLGGTIALGQSPDGTTSTLENVTLSGVVVATSPLALSGLSFDTASLSLGWAM